MSKGKKLTPQELRKKIDADKATRRRIFNDLCLHLTNGYSIDCFSALSEKSIYEYLRRFPDEFNEEKLHESMRKHKAFWEDIGTRQAKGSCLGNSRSWYLNMVNRFNWRDKMEVEAEHKGAVNINVVNYASKRASQTTDEDVNA